MKINKNLLNKNAFLLFILKFGLCFCFLYFGTLAVIGVSAPGGYYNPFIAEHLNFIDWLRSSLLSSSKALLATLNYKTYFPDKYELFIKNGKGIKMVYSCIGYGVMSFWAAFIFANKDPWIKKIKWVIGGWLAIWIINVIRISLLLIAINKKWITPGFDHHTWFNIIAYLLIFIMIFFYDKSSKHFNTTSAYRRRFNELQN